MRGEGEEVGYEALREVLGMATSMDLTLVWVITRTHENLEVIMHLFDSLSL